MEDIIKTEKKLLLAGLLHDIGKFYQRADFPLFKDGHKNPDNKIGEISWNLAMQMCPPTGSGGFGYHHVIWTSQFFEDQEIKKILNQLLEIKDNIWNDDDRNNITNLACQHHKPETELQAIIRLADWWSAGIDRTNPDTFEKEEISQDNIQWGKEAHKVRPLRSLFDLLKPFAEKSNIFSFRANALKPYNDEIIFPKPIQTNADGNSQEIYKNLWGEFIKEFQNLPVSSFQGFFNSLIFLLKKYTWAIPSNTNDMAHVSLFDHLKLTSAFAQCLYRHFKAHPESWKKKETNGPYTLLPQEDTYPVLLLAGDISGIQDFIYNISSQKAALSLKGRSFYIQLLIESAIERIINHQDIRATYAHVVYSSGGKFFMVLPNTSEIIEALNQLKKEFERELWEKHHGRLALLLEWIGFAYSSQSNTFKIKDPLDTKPTSKTSTNQTLANIWRSLNDRLNIAKLTIFKSVIESTPEQFFDESNPGLIFTPEKKICAVTGVILEKNQAKLIDEDPITKEKIYVENHVKDQIEIGQALKDADYLVSYSALNDFHSYLDKRAPTIKILKMDHYLLDEEALKHINVEGTITSADHCTVFKINDTDFLQSIGGNNMTFGFRFYGGNEQAYFMKNGLPVKNENRKQAKNFEELTRIKPDDPDTDSYLGILRMDVDGLGQVFIERIPENYRTFSFYATLSSMLDLFFSGYLNKLRNEDKYKEFVNILYSGGDDLFLYGRWDKIIEIAADIREKFRLFTQRDDLTISGGIVIVHDKFPIRKAAKLAEEAEDEAKKFRNGSKNAIHLFGETISWDYEFDYVKKWKTRFVNTLTNEKAPKGLLQRIIQYSLRKKAAERARERPSYPGERPDYSYKWHSAYALKRLQDKYSNDVSVKELLKDLTIELFSKPERNYDLLGVAARWAELDLRFLQKQKEKIV